MNNEAYTAYPRESEVLLKEGASAKVLAVERDFEIDNKNASFAKYNKR